MPEQMIVRKTIHLQSPPGRVWDALTNPDRTERYMFGCRVISGWNAGDSLVWEGATKEGTRMVFVRGTVVEAHYGKRLSFTAFDPNGTMKDIPENYTTVTYELTEESGGTLLSVTQGDFAKTEDGKRRYQETERGWDFALAGLKDLLRTH